MPNTKTARAVKRNLSAGYLFERVYFFAWGVIAGMFAAVAFLSIIGIPLGAIAGATSFGFFRIAFGVSTVNCAHCLAPADVKHKEDFFNCVKCKNNNIVEWETVKGRRAAKRLRADIERDYKEAMADAGS